jgi:hypothetical protein
VKWVFLEAIASTTFYLNIRALVLSGFARIVIFQIFREHYEQGDSTNYQVGAAK